MQDTLDPAPDVGAPASTAASDPPPAPSGTFRCSSGRSLIWSTLWNRRSPHRTRGGGGCRDSGRRDHSSSHHLIRVPGLALLILGAACVGAWSALGEGAYLGLEIALAIPSGVCVGARSALGVVARVVLVNTIGMVGGAGAYDGGGDGDSSGWLYPEFP